jgi:hypothetical protein
VSGPGREYQNLYKTGRGHAKSAKKALRLKKWRDQMHLAASDSCRLSGAVIAVDAETA